MLILKKPPLTETDSSQMFIAHHDGDDSSDVCNTVAMAMTMAADLLHFSISTLDVIAPLVQTAAQSLPC